jgi:hypothetical protein
MHNFHNQITTYDINQQKLLILLISFINVVNSTMFPFTMFPYTVLPITIFPFVMFPYATLDTAQDMARLTTQQGSRQGTAHDIPILGSRSLCSHSATSARLKTNPSPHSPISSFPQTILHPISHHHTQSRLSNHYFNQEVRNHNHQLWNSTVNKILIKP